MKQKRWIMKNRMKATAVQLKKILKKLNSGGTLSESENMFIEEVRNKTTLPGIVKTTVKDWTKGDPKDYKFYHKGESIPIELQLGETTDHYIRYDHKTTRLNFLEKEIPYHHAKR
jgi:hypothetical protein